jgi:hypothetical protein
MPRPAIETVEFVPHGEHGTRIVGRFRLTNRGRIPLLTLRATRPLLAAFWRRGRGALLSIIEEDAAALGLDEAGAPQGRS